MNRDSVCNSPKYSSPNCFSYNLILPIQVWPHGKYPLIPVGKMVLNRNPKNYFNEVEQIAFSPAHMIPGVEASPDKMLQVCTLYIYTESLLL